MLTYNLQKKPGLPLYEALYRCIREDILTGALQPGEKLPSKRALAQNLEISKITVEAAYDQLLSEGFLSSRERQGYFVEKVPGLPKAPEPLPPEPEREKPGKITQEFPFSVWSRLQREVMLDYGKALLAPMPNVGVWELRRAIAEHLRDFRGLAADPGCILIGAGSDFLYNLLVQLLGRELTYAVEEPGYQKIHNIYRAAGAQSIAVPMDTFGVRPDGLGKARVLHISPNHHFPTGIITTRERRQELIAWVRAAEGWIIEDDYDSEFRFDAHPMSAMQTLDGSRVIYMNSFSKSLAPSIRISYMVLPPALMEKYRRELGFYSCTVPSFEQYTLARFLSRGHFEKHINRMRRLYRSRRNRILEAIRLSQAGSRLTILEKDAGLHFLVKVDTRLSDRALTQALEEQGLKIPSLVSFYREPGEDRHCLVVSYADLEEGQVELLTNALNHIIDREYPKI